MIETSIIKYLNDTLDVSAYMEKPEGASGQYVIVQKTSGRMRNHIYSSTFAIQSYADTLLESAELNNQVISAMLEAVALDDIGSVRLNSNYNFTNSAQKQHRYQAVFDVVHY